MLSLCVFLVLVLLHPCLACKDDQCREMEFPSYLSFVGKRLTNHVIRTITVTDQDECELQCYLDHNCVSINFEFLGTHRNCDLNNSTDNEHHEDFTNAHGYFYRGTENACGVAPCKNNATCQFGFTNKRYRCLCTSGFTGQDCEVDINECEVQTHKCHVNAVCQNTKGSYSCACKAGYIGDGRNCGEFSINSTILSNNEHYLRNLFLFLAPAVGHISHWLLCFRASSHGTADSYFHDRCDGKRVTITIIRVNEYVFGGYVDIPWESSGGESFTYGNTPKAFIFSLRNSEQRGAFKSMVKNPENAIYNNIFLGPTFGKNDIRIDRTPGQPEDKVGSVTNFGNNYSLPSNVQNPQTILAGKNRFQPNEVEVFYLKTS